MRRGVRTGKVGGVAPEIPQSAEARSYPRTPLPARPQHYRVPHSGDNALSAKRPGIPTRG